MVWAQNLPRSAERYWDRQHDQIEAADRAVASIWRDVAAAPELVAGYRAAEGDIVSLTQTAQLRLVEGAQPYTEQVLEEMGQPATQRGAVNPYAFVGLAGDGREVAGTLRQSVPTVFAQMRTGVPREKALEVGGRFLSLLLTTVLADVARAAEKTAAGAAGVNGWVRMLEPPSCSRCAILAGRVYSMSTGFQRHPRCDCRHVPTSQAAGKGMVSNPRQYFDSLPTAEQNRIFTESGAEAIRNGADPARVVNARRGMVRAQSPRAATSQVFGRDLYLTRTGWRNGTRQVRLMPESLAEVAAGDADEYIRLLRIHGYLI